MPISRTHLLNTDTKKYINRVNALRKINGAPPMERSDTIDIDNFVVGLKDLNLWGYYCGWILQLRYNLGASTLVASIGGLGQFDGSIVGGSLLWDQFGLKAVSTSSARMQSNLLPPNRTLSAAIGGIFRLDSNAQQAHRLITTDIPNTTNGLGFDAFNVSANTLRKLSDSGANFGQRPTQMAHVAVGDGISPENSFSAFNLTYSLNTLKPILSPFREFRIGDAINGICLGTYSLAWWINCGLTSAKYMMIYNLHKQTIGRNLNLP
jgi:hypothetical protein